MEKQPHRDRSIKLMEGEAACKTLQKYFVNLLPVTTSGLVPHTLYSKDMLDQKTFEYFSNETHTDTDKGMKILLCLQKVVQIDPGKFDTLCQILEEGSLTKEWAQSLKDDFKQHLTQMQNSSNSKELDKLKKKLEIYVDDRSDPENQEMADKLIKRAIKQYVEALLQDGASRESLKDHIRSLCHKELGLIPADLHDSILNDVDGTITEQLSTNLHRNLSLNPSPSSPAQHRKTSKLFCKNTIYHAGLCCHAVTTSKSTTVQKFLSGHGHSLKKMSLSISEGFVDQYLIASDGNTLYFAFKSAVTISTWLEEYKSFHSGLEEQVNRVPLRFFIEQLQMGKRIVITGFSFGGMLACSVIANLWRETYINATLLEENVICISFGQPLIAIPSVQEAIRDFPVLEKTIHLVFNKDDVIPGLMHYFEFGCLNYTSMKSLGSATNISKSSSDDNLGKKIEFRSQFGQLFLPGMVTLQKVANKKPSYSGVLSSSVSPQAESQAVVNIKTALRQLSDLTTADSKPGTGMFPGICYVMSTEQNQGLIWSELPRHIVATTLHIDKATYEKFDGGIFKQHNISQYRNSTLRSHLEKEPSKFVSPSTQGQKQVSEIEFLKPDVRKVEVHVYPKENAIVLEGENLWFCHMICLGKFGQEKRIPTPAKTISRKSIHFNYKQSENDKKEFGPTCANMTVTLYSHFYNPLKNTVIVKHDWYSFSVRQIQLAKHTPTEVIELAYWTAMLERNTEKGQHQQPSKRFTAIVRFLEEAVNVVPLESILHAIAFSSDNTALECAKALKESNVKLPNSVMAFSGLVDACIHLSTGVSLTNLDKDELNFHRRNFTSLHISKEEMGGRPNVSDFEPTYASVVSRQFDHDQSLILPQHYLPAFFEMCLPFLALALNSISYNPLDQGLADFMEGLLDQYVTQNSQRDLPIVSKKFIKQLYPVSPLRHTMYIPLLQSPITVLKEARKQLECLEEFQEVSGTVAEGTKSANEQMLTMVKDIHETNLQVCTALLAAFMEQQIQIPLLSSPIDMASSLLASSAPVALGVWTLFSMSLEDLQKMLSSTRGNALHVEIEAYIAGVLDPETQVIEDQSSKAAEDRKYAGKLQFLLQGITHTATCSTEYISYSLEYQLCKHLKFDKSLSAKNLTDTWDEVFKDDALSLVAATHRPLIACWLKWVLLVHELREILASYTCVGIIGLVNSGKSQLVKTLFKAQAMVGTTKSKRTTVPFLYNYDGTVDGFDVIDFPGVDDKDTVPGLAKLLINLAQAVIFVVDYRKINTEPAEAWLHRLAKENIPVLVCLTFADRLLVECKGCEGESRNIDSNLRVKQEFENIKGKLGVPLERKHPPFTIQLCCFNITGDSNLSVEELQEAGVNSPHSVGDWLVELFKGNDQQELAKKLKFFFRQT